MIFVLTAWNLFPSGGNDTVHDDRHKRGRLGTKAPGSSYHHPRYHQRRPDQGWHCCVGRSQSRETDPASSSSALGSRWTYLPCTCACSLARLGRYYHSPFGINFLSSFPERAVVLGPDNQRAGDAVSGRVSAATVILAFDVPGHNSSSSREKTARSCSPSSSSHARRSVPSRRKPAFSATPYRCHVVPIGRQPGPLDAAFGERPSRDRAECLGRVPLATFVCADAVADLRRPNLPVRVEQADGPDDPAGRAVQHHQVDALSLPLRPVHAVGERLCHLTGVWRRTGRQRLRLRAGGEESAHAPGITNTVFA
jgi:hypothetical protein